ncbi:hypothetical protein [Actinoplanes sp. ATCC 53533]|uniref:hypothetical protein n=1 Tax=Actinoplanes sp. ATCC 53533 TaxID=1288362 RepID=UPI0013158935
MPWAAACASESAWQAADRAARIAAPLPAEPCPSKAAIGHGVLLADQPELDISLS